MNNSNETTGSQYGALYGGNLDGELAKKMINEFKTKKAKLKLSNCMWAIFDKDKMSKIYSDPTVIEVKFFVGVFLDDSPPKKKDAPVIIMQVKKTGSQTLVPEYEYSVGDTLCPPPNDAPCGSIESE